MTYLYVNNFIELLTIINFDFTSLFLVHFTNKKKYHESLPVPRNMLPFSFGWNCFKVFPQFDGLLQNFIFTKADLPGFSSATYCGAGREESRSNLSVLCPILQY